MALRVPLPRLTKDVVEGEPQNQDHALGGIAIDFERTPYPSYTEDGTDLIQARFPPPGANFELSRQTAIDAM